METKTVSRNRELLTYSFVSQGIYGVTDRLSGILPFFLPVIKEMQGRIFDPEEFVSRSNQRYPWSINTDICYELVPRFCRAGWLKEVRNGADISYVTLSIRDYGRDDEHLERATQDLAEIGLSFHDFLESISPLQMAAYTPDDLQELLLEWLVDKRAFERSAILAALETDQPTRRSKKPVLAESAEQSSLQKRDEDYLCARFIDHIAVHHGSLFEKLVAISAIAFIVEIALDITKPAPQAINLRANELYFDGPFVMDLLQLSGKERYNNASYIFTRLKHLHAQLYIFGHSCDEIRDNLKAVLYAHPGERFGPTAEGMRKGEVLEDYARAVLNDVEGSVERIGFGVRPIDLQSYPSTHTYFIDDLVYELKGRLPWEDLPSERDAKSVAFVMRSRGGKSSPALDRNRASLISGNVNLADIARRFCIERGLLKGNQIGPVIHRRQLSAMLWLALGSEEKKELTRRELLQRCADVVRLNPNVVRKARNILASYDASKASQFEALISSPRASQMIMDLTLGVPDVISRKNMDEILEEIRKTTIEDEKRRYEDEMEQLKKRHRENVGQIKTRHSKEISTLYGEKQQLAERIEEGESRLHELSQRVKDLEYARGESDRAICGRLLSSIGAYESSIRRTIRLAASIITALVGVGSALLSIGFDLILPLQAVVAIGIIVVALITAAQISDRWMLPFEKIIFSKKVDMIGRRLQEIGRTDLVNRLNVDHDARTVEIRED